MTHTNDSTSQPQQSSLSKRMLVGAGIGLVVISFFVLPVHHPDPAWGELWMIKPLIITPLAGAFGGLTNHIILFFHSQFGIHKAVAMIAGILVFIVALWLGIVLGLNGTLWN
jgi:hypothetical protein